MSTNPHSLSWARSAAACAGAAAILLLTGCGQSSAPAADVEPTTSSSATTSTTTPTSTTAATSSSTTVTETERIAAEVPPAVSYAPAPAPNTYVAPAPVGVTCKDGSIVADPSKCYDDYPYLGARQAPPPEGMFPADMTPINAADAGVTLGPYCGPVALANGCVEPGGQ